MGKNGRMRERREGQKERGAEGDWNKGRGEQVYKESWWTLVEVVQSILDYLPSSRLTVCIFVVCLYRVCACVYLGVVWSGKQYCVYYK